MFYWSSLSCSHVAKINLEGKVAIVHQPQIEGVKTNKMVTVDTQMYFRVDWQTNDVDQLISNLTTQCSNFGCSDGDAETCLCDVEIQETMLFSSDSEIASVEDVLFRATIGAFPPSPDDVGQIINGIAGLRKYPSGEDFSEETVFQIVDSYGCIHYRKNLKSLVLLGNGVPSFRNPVTFYALSEPTTRDAAYETDAALEHTFHHQNIAPFLAIRLAQRFGISNPSPRYVATVAHAFRSGNFKDNFSGAEYGSGQYGSLEATLAAVLLDRESQEALLDADPVQ
jgi:cullin-associated NEDD8-dissociated protein 1